jgi:hypothetical protein
VALKRGERLDCIKQIVAALVEDEIPQMELTLDTFGAPEVNRWECNDNNDYLISRLRNADDDILIELKSYVAGQGARVPISAVAGPWEEGRFRLFLSHTSAHKELAKEIRDHLRPYGFDVFVAHEDIKPTREWEQEIELALATCAGMLALITPDFIESKFCDQEVGYAMGRRLLVAAIMHGEQPHGFVGKWQGIPGEDPADELAARKLARKVFDVFVENEKTKAEMASVIVERYVNSTSFENARANTSRLMRIPKELWTKQMIEDVERAGKENSQVEDAFWYGGKVPSAVSEHLDELLGRKQDAAPVDVSDFISAGAGDDDIPF